MKKLLFLSLLSLATLSTSCEKNNVTPNGNTQQPVTDGTIQFINNSRHRYKVEIVGSTVAPFIQAGGTSVTKTFSQGQYKVIVTQQEGYVLYPTVLEYSPFINGNNLYISYP